MYTDWFDWFYQKTIDEWMGLKEKYYPHVGVHHIFGPMFTFGQIKYMFEKETRGELQS